MHNSLRPPSPAKNDDYQGWGCPDSEICAWDQRNGQGERLFQKDGTCDEYDIASVRDRLSSFENRTRFPVALYDWNDTVHQWDLLTTIAAGSKGNMGQSVDDRADMIKICG